MGTSSERTEVVSWDTAKGYIRFPGELMAEADRSSDDCLAGVRVYRGTHEASGSFFVSLNYGHTNLQICKVMMFNSRTSLATFLLGPDASTRTTDGAGDTITFAAMAECLAKIGEFN